MAIEKTVYDLAKEVAGNTANISVLMKLMYIMIGGILTQVVVFVGSTFKKGKVK